MNKFLNNTRGTENEIPVSRKIRNTILILCLGIVLGTFSKFLDNTASNALSFCCMVTYCLMYSNL